MDRTARAEPGSLGWAEQLVLHRATPCDCDDDGDDDDQHLVRLLQACVAGGEEVSQQEERRSGDAVDTVNQPPAVAKSSRVDKVVYLPDVLGHVLVLAVGKVEDEVADFPEFFLGRVVDADHMSYPMPAQFLQVS